MPGNIFLRYLARPRGLLARGLSLKHPAVAAKVCCIPENPRDGSETESRDPRQPNIKIPRKVLKGGLHLCAPCNRPPIPSCRFIAGRC